MSLMIRFLGSERNCFSNILAGMRDDTATFLPILLITFLPRLPIASYTGRTNVACIGAYIAPTAGFTAAPTASPSERLSTSFSLFLTSFLPAEFLSKAYFKALDGNSFPTGITCRADSNNAPYVVACISSWNWLSIPVASLYSDLFSAALFEVKSPRLNASNICSSVRSLPSLLRPSFIRSLYILDLPPFVFCARRCGSIFSLYAFATSALFSSIPAPQSSPAVAPKPAVPISTGANVPPLAATPAAVAIPISIEGRILDEPEVLPAISPGIPYIHVSALKISVPALSALRLNQSSTLP